MFYYLLALLRRLLWNAPRPPLYYEPLTQEKRPPPVAEPVDSPVPASTLTGQHPGSNKYRYWTFRVDGIIRSVRVNYTTQIENEYFNEAFAYRAARKRYPTGIDFRLVETRDTVEVG